MDGGQKQDQTGGIDYEDAIMSCWRDYGVINHAVARLERRGFKASELGLRFFREKAFSIYLLESPQPAVPNPKRVLITAGSHGDETEVAFGLLRFLERFTPSQESLTIVPVTNPRAYICGKIGLGYDYNRDFDPEEEMHEAVRIVTEALRGRKFDLFLDLHSDYAKKGFYLYERLAERKRKGSLGRRIVDRLEGEGFPINKDEYVHTGDIGKQRNYNGVVPSYKGEPTFEAHMAAKGTPYCFTLEFPEAALAEYPEKQLALVERTLQISLEEFRAIRP